MVRRYHSGMVPATFAQSSATNPELRFAVSFKPDGSYPIATLASGGGNSRMVSWLQSIPANTYVAWTFFHEPNDEIRGGTLNVTQFKQVYTQMRAALNSATLASGVTVKIAPCFMAYRLTDTPTYWSDSWVPATADMDLLTFDAYGNPGEGGATSSGSNTYGAATGSGYGTKYPLPSVRFQPMFDIINRLGWAQHWGILEVDSPARSWDVNETARARWFKDTNDLFLTQPYPPEIVLLWEAPSGVNWDQSFGRLSGSATPLVNALAPYIQGSP
jgi:hypothetical protein